ncbi:MAG: GTP-binding protein [Methanobacteriota archaeon]|nr:MAG: GTP-binding protein [Euryarchaeota archaeon]
MVTTWKILVIGEGAVGKTSIATRYTTGGFKESHLMTVGANFMLKNLEIGGKTIKLSIWDTAGQEKFRKVVESYYKGGKGVLICFAINDRRSFDALDYWYSSTQKQLGENAKYVLVGNKSDLENSREVSTEEAEQWATAHGMKYFETSALQNKNIKEVFEYLANLILQEE